MKALPWAGVIHPDTAVRGNTRKRTHRFDGMVGLSVGCEAGSRHGHYNCYRLSKMNDYHGKEMKGYAQCGVHTTAKNRTCSGWMKWKQARTNHQGNKNHQKPIGKQNSFIANENHPPHTKVPKYTFHLVGWAYIYINKVSWRDAC